MAASHLSPQAYERLREELDVAHGRAPPRDLALTIERARELGDISENADYDAAKNEQGKNEARVRQIEQILKTAVVVENTTGEVVEPGCLVELRYEGDDDAAATSSVRSRSATTPTTSSRPSHRSARRSSASHPERA